MVTLVLDVTHARGSACARMAELYSVTVDCAASTAPTPGIRRESDCQTRNSTQTAPNRRSRSARRAAASRRTHPAFPLDRAAGDGVHARVPIRRGDEKRDRLSLGGLGPDLALGAARHGGVGGP